MTETYEEILWCRKCKKERLTNEDMGTWMCQCRRGQGPGEKPQEKLLDKALRGINETQLLKEKTHV